MTNPSDRDIYNREDQQASYTDSSGNTHTYVKRTTESIDNGTTNPKSYNAGYLQGSNNERRYQQSNLAERDDRNTANGLLLGIILTSLASLVAIGFWYFNQRQNAELENTAPVVAPAPTNTPTPNPQQTTIIERTREIPVPIPQPPTTPTTAPSPPQVNITIPSPPSSQTNPQTTPTPNPATTNTPAPENNSDTPPTVEGSGTGNSDQ